MELTPQNKKAILIGAGVLVAGYFAYKYLVPNQYSSISLGYDPTRNGSAATTNTANFSAAKTVQDLYDAMKEMGTDEAAVKAALAPLTAAQFKQVYNLFGRRVYNTLSGNIYIPIWASEEDYKQPLKVWLKEELSDSEYKAMKLKFASTNLL